MARRWVLPLPEVSAQELGANPMKMPQQAPTRTRARVILRLGGIVGFASAGIATWAKLLAPDLGLFLAVTASLPWALTTIIARCRYR